MRVLSIGNFGTGWDSSICDEEHIAGALEELGHEVTRWQRDEIKDFMVTKDTLDFILIAQWDNYPNNWPISSDGKIWENVDFVPWLKHTYGCPVIYWAFDYQADGQEWHERLVREADLYLSKRIADSKYPNWQWLSQDFAPEFLDRHNPDGKDFRERDIDVLFTGSYLPWATERNETLKAVDEKFNLVIHSVNAWEGFKDVRPPIMDHGLPELYQNARVILAIDHTLEAGYWSDRSAQAMCCGGFVMQRYVPLMETHFPESTFFYSVEDCLEKLDFYLNTLLGQGRAIWNATCDYEDAQQNLKVKNRVKDLLTIVKNIL